MKKRLAMLFFAAFGLILFGCAGGESGTEDAGSEDTSEVETTASEAEDDAESAKSIRIGTMNTYTPYAYIGEDEEAAGYDVEVMKVAAERAGYEVEFFPVEWAALFTGLEGGEWDAVANQLTRTPERESMYHLGNIPYYKSIQRLVVRSDSDIESIEDLNGETLAQTTGANATNLLEDYLEENPGAFELSYTEATMAMILEDIINGNVVGNVNDPVTVALTAEENDLSDEVKIVGDGMFPSYVYMAFPQTDEGQQMRDDFDEALLEMIEDGTLEDLSVELLGENYNETLEEGIIN